MKKEDKAGLQLTVIVHLAVLIVLLVIGIGRQLSAENTFILDFSQQEELRKRQEEADMKQEVSKRIDELLKSAPEVSVRNVAVNTALKDDRNSSAEAEQLYKDAERLASELKNGFKSDIEEDARNEVVDIRKESVHKDETPYSGPSVLSWTLDGRKASHLPIPAYRCYGAGEVHVNIVVDQQGNVVNAKINDALSADDNCLRNFAIRAARLSKFNRDLSAPARQGGEIAYSFIAQ